MESIGYLPDTSSGLACLTCITPRRNDLLGFFKDIPIVKHMGTVIRFLYFVSLRSRVHGLCLLVAIDILSSVHFFNFTSTF
jgi:hypothetical protein